MSTTKYIKDFMEIISRECIATRFRHFVFSKDFYGTLIDRRYQDDPILTNKERDMLDEIASMNKKLYVVSNSDLLSREEFAERINA